MSETDKFKIDDFLENPRTKFYAEGFLNIEKKIQESIELASDPEMAELVEADLKDLEAQKENLKKQILEIAEKEKEEEKFPNELVLEVRAGAGGDEASLFAYQLAEMYQRYADKMG